jgi:hypothetical protein
VRCRDATASSFVAKIPSEVFAHFHAVAVKVTVVCGIDCLACQDEFYMNDPLDVEENFDHDLDFALRLSRLFLSAQNRCHIHREIASGQIHDSK